MVSIHLQLKGMQENFFQMPNLNHLAYLNPSKDSEEGSAFGEEASSEDDSQDNDFFPR